MASRKKNGVTPLGHAPLSNVSLEGPKKHHDFHGNDASVPARGNARAIPGEHWERKYDLCEPSPNMYATSGSDWVAKSPSSRKTTHLKVNETDH